MTKLFMNKTVFLREIARDVPSTWDWGTPPPRKDMGPVEVLWDGDGVPPKRIWDQWKYYGKEMGTPSRKDMGPVEVLWDGDGVPP